MNQAGELYASCQVKLSSVRSPADGEEQFPDPVRDEMHVKSDPSKMVLAQTHHFREVKEPAESPVSSGQETPAYCRWAQNLNNLLEDLDGTQLFKTYLNQEHGDCRALDFWFAVKGFRSQEYDNLPKTMMALARSVNFLPDISPETKADISRRIASSSPVDKTIFNQAQVDIENVMRKTTYPNFLRSDIYIQYMQDAAAACHTPDNETADSSSDIAAPAEAESKSVDQSTASKADSNDSGQLPKGASTACKEPVSKTNPCSAAEKDPHASADLQTVYEDSELVLIGRNSHRVSRMVHKSYMKSKYSEIARLKPESQAGHYLKANTPGYNTCYTKYAGYLPPSTQDSELQSLSSDAQTDDSLSVVSSNIDHDSFHSNKPQKKSHKSCNHGVPLNRNSCLPYSDLRPRTDLMPQGGKKLSPHELASILTQKLLKVQESQKLEERLRERLQEDQKGDVPSKVESSSHHKHSPLFLFGAKSQDTAQDILDNHVSRVFKDSAHMTPSPSPGCLTPSASQLPEEQSAKQREVQGYTSSQQPSESNSFPYLFQHNQFNSCINSVKHRKDFDSYASEGVDCPSDYDMPQSVGYSKQQQISYHSIEQPYEHSLGRHTKDSRRASSKRASSLDGSSSSCFDSGISGTGVTSSQERLTTWLEMKKSSSHGSDPDIVHYPRKSPTSRSPVFGQLSKKPVAYSNTRTVTLESGGTPWPMAPTTACSAMVETVYCRGLYNNQVPQTLAQESNMMPLHDTNTQLLETRRRLESMYSAKQKMKKSSRRSYSTPAPTANQSSSSNSEMITVAYSYGRTAVPFLSRLPGKCMTLRQFKSLLTKKGNFKYFFKKENEDFGVVFEEISDDCEILPLWEGKVHGLIEQMEV